MGYYAHKYAPVKHRDSGSPARHGDVLEEADDERGPARLVGGAQAAPGITVEVLVEQRKVAEMWIGREAPVPAVTRPPCAIAVWPSR
jgi:hypothetical protein